jgi:hypothetical protein
VKNQETKTIKYFRPNFTEEEAKASVEFAKKIFGRGMKRTNTEWLSSIPVYVPFWLVGMEMRLKDPLRKDVVLRKHSALVNGLTGRAMLTRGGLLFDTDEVTGVILDNEYATDKILEAARMTILMTTQKFINPPPCRMLPGEELLYYPMALVHCRVRGKEDARMFDYYRGGALDRMFTSYLRHKERLDEKRGIRPNVSPIPEYD